MRNLIWKLRKKLTLAAGLLAGGAVAAYGLTIPPQFSPRSFPTQQTHYIRGELDFNSCTLVAAGLNGKGISITNQCAVKVGALPYNAWLSRVQVGVATVFNSGTSDWLAVGTSSTTRDGDISLFQNYLQTANTVSTLSFVPTAAATLLTGASNSQTGLNGGFDVWIKWGSTGTAPTAGKAVVVLEYFGPNDGNCTTVPMGATAASC